MRACPLQSPTPCLNPVTQLSAAPCASQMRPGPTTSQPTSQSNPTLSTSTDQNQQNTSGTSPCWETHERQWRPPGPPLPQGSPIFTLRLPMAAPRHRSGEPTHGALKLLPWRDGSAAFQDRTVHFSAQQPRHCLHHAPAPESFCCHFSSLVLQKGTRANVYFPTSILPLSHSVTTGTLLACASVSASLVGSGHPSMRGYSGCEEHTWSLPQCPPVTAILLTPEVCDLHHSLPGWTHICVLLCAPHLDKHPHPELTSSVGAPLAIGRGPRTQMGNCHLSSWWLLTPQSELMEA